MFNFFRNSLYITITPELIEITHAETGRKLAEPPLLAIETKRGKDLNVAVGTNARLLAGKPNVRIENGFLHPRTLLADFTIAEQTLKHLIKQAMPSAFFVARPVVVEHPLKMLEGGLTQIEIRAFAELTSMAGASQVYVWQGPTLLREQLLKRSFPAEGQLLFP
ncbi:MULTISPECIES: rod shape-determining protein [Methylomonas]|uniref:Rod shape-determining protein MreB n=2 Tax=Methylomonas TaxID=416 RepID=A0A126T808_9GAMM|nr:MULTISPECIES: rod shape-determining protein [Methylomonas]AMK78217.1 hypothetical protein JT25_017285 [Methylomonas denitrificans]OAI03937.1 hypothetical protein A1342_05220 [Methylomonas methanica]TCV87755.1 rod shape-determining protein MreB [Methylomonas methanica]